MIGTDKNLTEKKKGLLTIYKKSNNDEKDRIWK